MDKTRRGFVVVYAHGLVVYADRGVRPVVRNSKEMAKGKDGHHSPSCTSLSAHFGLQCPRVDGYKTFHREHNHQPRWGVVRSISKNVPQVAPGVVTPKGLPLVVLERQLNDHNEDQDKVVGHRNSHQVEGTWLGQHAVSPQDDQKGDDVGWRKIVSIRSDYVFSTIKSLRLRFTNSTTLTLITYREDPQWREQGRKPPVASPSSVSFEGSCPPQTLLWWQIYPV